MKGFTLVELLVVVAMIAILAGALATSVSGAQSRARIQKATSDVKVITQAILAYENFGAGGNYELPTMKDAEANQGSLGFLLGQGGTSKAGDTIPALLMVLLKDGAKLRDPWGMPYTISITKGSGTVKIKTATGNMQSGYFLPNVYRLRQDERDLEAEGGN